MEHNDIAYDLYAVDHTNNEPDKFIGSFKELDVVDEVVKALVASDDCSGYSYDVRVYKMRKVSSFRVHDGECHF